MRIPKFHTVTILALMVSAAGMTVTAHAGDSDMSSSKMSHQSMHHESSMTQGSMTDNHMKGASNTPDRMSDSHMKSSGMDGDSMMHGSGTQDSMKPQGKAPMKSGM